MPIVLFLWYGVVLSATAFLISKTFSLTVFVYDSHISILVESGVDGF